MKFLLRLAAWSTLAFAPAWFLAHPWQGVIAKMAAGVAAPGAEVDFTELELFYPFDLGVYAALCLASAWAPWGRRLRTLVIGFPILVALEVLSLAVAMRSLMAASPQGVAEAQRFAGGLIRTSGLVFAAAVWLLLLGRERLPFGGEALTRRDR